MNTRNIILLVSIAAMVLFSAGCIDSGPHPTIVPSQEEAPNLYPDVTPEQTFRRSTQIPQPERNDDAIFIQLVGEMGTDVSRHLNDLGTHMTEKDYLLAYYDAARLESTANVYIDDISECVVTDDVKPVQTHALKILDELRLGSIDAQAGLGLSVDIDELNKANVHFKKAVEYINQLG